MAKLSVTYVWNGEPATYSFSTEYTPAELQLKVFQIWNDGFVKIPTQGLAVDSECPRSVYVIPTTQILRLRLELADDEECPDIEV